MRCYISAAVIHITKDGTYMCYSPMRYISRWLLRFLRTCNWTLQQRKYKLSIIIFETIINFVLFQKNPTTMVVFCHCIREPILHILIMLIASWDVYLAFKIPFFTLWYHLLKCTPGNYSINLTGNAELQYMLHVLCDLCQLTVPKKKAIMI